MAFSAGERITAARLNRLAPATYYAQASGVLAAGSTTVDIPGVSITLSTSAANAIYVAQAVADFDLTGATTSLGSVRLVVDSVPSGLFVVNSAEVTTDRVTGAQSFRGTLATAGSHTLKLQGTTPANMQINIYTTLVVTIYEVA